MPNPRLAGAVAVALLLYARTIGFDFTYLDDDVLIRDDQAFLAQPSSLVRSFARTYFQKPSRDHAYYRPVVNASYGLDANLGGKSPGIYHATNVLLHGLAVGLLFLLLRRLGHSENLALLGSLLFAVHPALTETVAWIPGRNDSLLAVFAFSAWLLLLRGQQAEHRWARMGHVALFLGALLCKETAVVLPLLWLGHSILLERRPWRSALAPLAGWAGALVVYGIARAVVLSDHAGLQGVSARAALANLALLPLSLGKLILPIRLSVLAVPEDIPMWPGILAAGLLVALFFVRGVHRPAVWFGLACFVGFLLPGLPASTLVVLENRLYLPALGVVLVACELARATSWRGRRAWIAGGTAVALLASLAFHHSGNFRDRLAFSQAAVRGSPHSSLAHRNLGVAYHVAGDENAAWREYQAALAEDAGEPVAHNNLAVILMAHGRLPEAERQLRQELAQNPEYIPAERNLALVLRAMKRIDEAVLHWQRVVDLGSNDREAARELAAYYQTRDPAKAERYQRKLGP
jgi:tetratricopeptide (TPR) repeat protein